MHKLTYDEIVALEWKEELCDNNIASWRENWFLDGEKARVLFAKGNIMGEQERGLELYSGPNANSDDCHAVLWSNKSFTADNIRITFDYTRLDKDNEDDTSVCILYLLAQGSGEDGFDEDISVWNDKRKVPKMSLYFDNMNLYHISFAAFDGKNEPRKYIRARQYKAGNFSSTNIAPDYDPHTLFKTGEKYHIDAIKFGNRLFFKSDNLLCTWPLDDKKMLKSGRVGIRQMGGRSGRFSNITISTLSFNKN